jgi:hypothetical protein
MEMMAAYLLIKNSDRKQFGNTFKDMSKSYAYGTKQWPESIDAARTMLEKVKNLNETDSRAAKDLSTGQTKPKSEKKKPPGR